MQSHLMFKDRDFTVVRQFTPRQKTLMADLSLDTLFDRLADGDTFTREVVAAAVMDSLTERDAILYRQAALADSIRNQAAIARLYAIVTDCIEMEKKALHVGIFSNYPSAVLYGSINVLFFFFDKLAELRRVAESETGNFSSAGFNGLFATLMAEVGDDYLRTAGRHIALLKKYRAIKVGARLGAGNIGERYVLRKPPEPVSFWRFCRHPAAVLAAWRTALFSRRRAAFTVRLADRDEAGARIFSELGDRGIVLIANALSQSVEHILVFLQTLRRELAFYLAGARLYAALQEQGIAVCFPTPHPAGQSLLEFDDLYEAVLAITLPGSALPNSLAACRHGVYIVTGANQGGKTTWLRSVATAHLMMQCGLFVCARRFSAGVASGLFSHFKKEEDAAMKSGKLDEELDRMNGIIDAVTPHAAVFFNESFAATNSREGSLICGEITRALAENHIKIFMVTHLSEFAGELYQAGHPAAEFLVAERKRDGERTFRIRPGEPEDSSYGEDVYARIFSTAARSPRPAPALAVNRDPDAAGGDFSSQPER
ncbi:MutS-related protein [Martelella alba]|uniref:DNA mismatch repair protein MutS n=1 Tax=Martelella alba TaxID=2590451 RepID=A0ABY2SPN7_9HYPH|nr:DNA mismatch repair protein MutS [Martelella alba]TKI07841.1 DNA mismatch repair protein MutS [Martelella alba]